MTGRREGRAHGGDTIFASESHWEKIHMLVSFFTSHSFPRPSVQKARHRKHKTWKKPNVTSLEEKKAQVPSAKMRYNFNFKFSISGRKRQMTLKLYMLVCYICLVIHQKNEPCSACLTKVAESSPRWFWFFSEGDLGFFSSKLVGGLYYDMKVFSFGYPKVLK